MPCWTITEVKLELKGANLDMLETAIKRVASPFRLERFENGLTWNGGTSIGGSYNQKTGELTIRGDKKVGEEIKKAYSAVLVETQAKKYGWQLKKVGAYKYEILKR